MIPPRLIGALVLVVVSGGCASWPAWVGPYRTVTIRVRNEQHPIVGAVVWFDLGDAGARLITDGKGTVRVYHVPRERTWAIVEVNASPICGPYHAPHDLLAADVTLQIDLNCKKGQ